MLNPGEKFRTDRGTLIVIRLLGRGKSGYSWLAVGPDGPVVLKTMHNEPCDYYQFSGNKTKREVDAYHVLLQHDIPMPRLLEWNAEKNFLVKEFIDGTTGDEAIANRQINHTLIAWLFAMSNMLRLAGINLDWFPANFVLNDNQIYYIDYEINYWAAEWSLEEWGLYYWANSAGFQKWRESNDISELNDLQHPGKPLKDGVQTIVHDWLATFRNESAG